MILFAGYLASAGTQKTFMNSELSLKHSLLENNCEKCHKPWKGVDDLNCLQCHLDKKHFKRAADSKIEHDPNEYACFNCHSEHKGRFHNLKLAKNSTCEECHVWESHPEFKKETVRVPIDGSIIFPHQIHYEAAAYDEDSCDMCHKKTESGDSFIMLSFDEVCSMCHSIEEHTIDAKELLTCPTCHLSGKYKIPPRDPLLRNIRYSHRKHEKKECGECHDNINASEDATDLHLPKVSKCLGCHTDNLVTNNCGTCHDFHVIDKKRLKVAHLAD